MTNIQIYTEQQYEVKEWCHYNARVREIGKKSYEPHWSSLEKNAQENHVYYTKHTLFVDNQLMFDKSQMILAPILL